MSQSELDNMTQYRRLQTQSQCGGGGGGGGGAKFNQVIIIKSLNITLDARPVIN